MSIYDQAHSLARAIRTSGDYLAYQEARKKLAEENSAQEMLLDFRKEQIELQRMKLNNEDTAAQEEKVKKMFEVIRLNLLICDFLAKEHHFAQIMADVQKILMEAIDPDNGD